MWEINASRLKKPKFVEKKCLYCNKKYQSQECRSERKYCSNECRYNSRKGKKTGPNKRERRQTQFGGDFCLTCDCFFKRNRFVQKYCSLICANKRGKNW